MLADTDPKTSLRIIIDDLSQRLLDYSKTTNPNNQYINRQQNLINTLIAVEGNLNHLHNYAYLQAIDQQLCKLLAESPEIDGIIISLNLRSAPRNIACIALTCP